MLTYNVYPQAHQERAYQQFCASKAVEKAQQQEGYYEQLVAVNQSEIACIPTLIHSQHANSLNHHRRIFFLTTPTNLALKSQTTCKL